MLKTVKAKSDVIFGGFKIRLAGCGLRVKLMDGDVG